jgi:GTP-binding protein
VFNVDDRWYLVDLPGYGYAKASRADRTAFQALLSNYVGLRQELAAAIWLLDVRRDPSPDDLAMGQQLAARQVPILAAVTKADKITQGQRATRVQAILKNVGLTEDQAVLTSVKTGEGIRDLRDSIEALVKGRRTDGRPDSGA